MTSALPYQLIALHLPSTRHRVRGDQGAWRYLGHHPDLDATLRARVEDVLAQLAANDGWLIQVEHLIVGPGPDGPATISCCVSELGADPRSDRIPAPFDLSGARRWLLATHQLT